MLFLLVFLLIPAPAGAEPWLSTRFAQNCSGCHAPQRVNVEPSKRRCSLSCQGCHVNPNGGGLRSHYGKWTENRWLKSWRSDILANKKNVEPYPKQKYAKIPLKKMPEKARKRLEIQGYRLQETTEPVDEKDFGVHHGRHKVIAKNRQTYLYQLPEGDPWRLMAQSKFDGGVDIRWLTSRLSGTRTPAEGEVTELKGFTNFLMSFDTALRYRPVYRRYHLVYEGRFSGRPTGKARYDQALSSAATRSLYVLVEDLPYNVFVMTGYYRPLFANQNPDHYALAERLISQAVRGDAKSHSLTFHATTIGTAPNVPYLNLHVLHRQFGEKDTRTTGFALNTGFRFVTLGASINFSYWKTTALTEVTNNATQLFSMGMAGKLGRFIAEFDAVSYERENKTFFSRGGVHTLTGRVRLWREIYGEGQFAFANTAPTLYPGSSNQLKAGLRAFLVPGLDLALHFEQTRATYTNDEVADSQTRMTSQLHMYF